MLKSWDKTMRKIFLMMVLTVMSSSTMASLLEDCNATASEVNKGLPVRLDKSTTLMSTICIQGNNNRLIYLYTYIVEDALKGKLSEKYISKLKTRSRNGACSTPELKKGLKVMDYEHRYSDTKGTILFSVKINEGDCTN